MTRNIQSNYMVPWWAFKSLPAVAASAVCVLEELDRPAVNLHSLLQERRSSRILTVCVQLNYKKKNGISRSQEMQINR